MQRYERLRAAKIHASRVNQARSKGTTGLCNGVSRTASWYDRRPSSRNRTVKQPQLPNMIKRTLDRIDRIASRAGTASSRSQGSGRTEEKFDCVRFDDLKMMRTRIENHKPTSGEGDVDMLRSSIRDLNTLLDAKLQSMGAPQPSPIRMNAHRAASEEEEEDYEENWEADDGDDQDEVLLGSPSFNALKADMADTNNRLSALEAAAGIASFHGPTPVTRQTSVMSVGEDACELLG